MKLGIVVGLGPGYVVLDGEPAPHEKRQTSPTLSIFTGACFACESLRPYNPRPMSFVAKRLDGSKWHLVERLASVQPILC